MPKWGESVECYGVERRADGRVCFAPKPRRSKLQLAACKLPFDTEYGAGPPQRGR